MNIVSTVELHSANAVRRMSVMMPTELPVCLVVTFHVGLRNCMTAHSE